MVSLVVCCVVTVVVNANLLFIYPVYESFVLVFASSLLGVLIGSTVGYTLLMQRYTTPLPLSHTTPTLTTPSQDSVHTTANSFLFPLASVVGGVCGVDVLRVHLLDRPHQRSHAKTHRNSHERMNGGESCGLIRIFIKTAPPLKNPERSNSIPVVHRICIYYLFDFFFC